jgi:hypothetical protein
MDGRRIAKVKVEKLDTGAPPAATREGGRLTPGS